MNMGTATMKQNRQYDMPVYEKYITGAELAHGIVLPDNVRNSDRLYVTFRPTTPQLKPCFSAMETYNFPKPTLDILNELRGEKL